MKDFWLQNGTSALIASLMTSSRNKKYVAVQASVCPNVIAAIFLSEYEPWFVDIDKENYGLSVTSLENAINHVSAVICVHAYGIPSNIKEVHKLCIKHNVPLIEDCAQAEGACISGKSVGSFGDYAVFSYGAGKILDLEGGGRVVGNTEKALDELQYAIKSFDCNIDTESLDKINQFYKKIYNSYYLSPPEACVIKFSKILKQQMLIKATSLSVKKIDEINKAIDVLETNILVRLEKVEYYKRLLRNTKEIKIPELPEGAVPWRFNILMEPEKRNLILKSMLSKGMNVSSWYPDISKYLSPDVFKAENLIVTKWVGDRILNLWLDCNTELNTIKGNCNYINTIIRDSYCV